ncbi:hypothetical protein [Methyloterricola oryzae]|uniref:hypothetical protein n=1 Tax=Methyloterricola oryzae TaxID=1495050 RepID=UPI0011AF93EA|nr:hypothetical protein [Methyloterricola oryzae]
MSAIAFVLVVLRGAYEKRLMISAKYVLLFGFIFLLLTSSLIINDVQPGTIFIGARTYFKYVPFFLMPLVYEYSEEEFKKQLLLLAGLGLLQLPMAALQRFVLYSDLATGDVVTGTLETSGVLTIMMLSFLSIVMGMYLRKKLSLRHAALLMIFFIAPAGLDETKVTVILLPLALGIPVFIVAKLEKNLRSLVPFAVMGGIVFVLFVGMYQTLYSSRGDMQKGGIFGFLTDPKMLETYVYGGAAESATVRGIDREGPKVIGAKKKAAKRAERFDGIIVAWKVLSADWAKLLVGVGIGNVTDSFLGKNFAGKYALYSIYFSAGITDLSLALWEIGLLGILCVFILMAFIFFDSFALARSSDLYGAFAIGWVAVTVMIVVVMVYQSNIVFNAISYLFWFFSGQVIAAKNRLDWSKNWRRS